MRTDKFTWLIFIFTKFQTNLNEQLFLCRAVSLREAVWSRRRNLRTRQSYERLKFGRVRARHQQARRTRTLHRSAAATCCHLLHVGGQKTWSHACRKSSLFNSHPVGAANFVEPLMFHTDAAWRSNRLRLLVVACCWEGRREIMFWRVCCQPLKTF